jgi:hypothetical protein
MTKKEMNLRIFKGEEIPHPFFQPRLEPWYAWHKQFNKLPPRYKDKSLLELYDELDISMRYVHYYTGMPDPVEVKYSEKVKINYEIGENEAWEIIETPYCQLIRKMKINPDGIWHTVKFPVENSLDELRGLKWLYQNTTYHFSKEKFQQGSDFIGDRGEPQFWVPKSPYQALAQIWMKLDRFIYALNDHREEVEDLMKVIDDSYDQLYEEIIGSGMVRIINFGENIHDHLFSPAYFEKYLIPFYEKRSGQLRKARIFTHIHIDGYFKSLLKYLKYLPFDGYEALTPLPQGDVSLEEIKEHIGDKVLLDGLPAVFFSPEIYPSREPLEEFTEKIIKMFHPRLVLGVSDEVPEGGGEEALERVRWVANYCKSFGK